MSTFNLNALSQLGAFTGAPVAKQVKWQNGDQVHEFTIHVRPQSYASVLGAATATSQGEAAAVRIATSVVDEQGKPVFTVADINGTANEERGPMASSLVIALLNAINEVDSGKLKTSQS